MVRKQATGFSYVKSFPVIKRTKDGKGIRQGMGYHGRASHEYVVLCEKGRRRFTHENWPDFFEPEWTGDAESRLYTPDHKPYPTAKPWQFFSELMNLSSVDGETLLDPFAGSGTLADACREYDRKVILIDKSRIALETINNRIFGIEDLPLLRATA